MDNHTDQKPDHVTDERWHHGEVAIASLEQFADTLKKEGKLYGSDRVHHAISEIKRWRRAV